MTEKKMSGREFINQFVFASDSEFPLCPRQTLADNSKIYRLMYDINVYYNADVHLLLKEWSELGNDVSVWLSSDTRVPGGRHTNRYVKIRVPRALVTAHCPVIRSALEFNPDETNIHPTNVDSTQIQLLCVYMAIAHITDTFGLCVLYKHVPGRFLTSFCHMARYMGMSSVVENIARFLDRYCSSNAEMFKSMDLHPKKES